MKEALIYFPLYIGGVPPKPVCTQADERVQGEEEYKYSAIKVQLK